MQKVSEIVSSKIGDALTNVQTWGNVFYNVQAYGIFANGIDMTSKLQTLVNLANSEGRTAIFFPHGVYTVTSIVNDANIYFFGDNASFTGGYSRFIYQIGSAPINSTFVSVMDAQFGAKGDGVTDDTLAFQNAINFCISTGKALCIPGNVQPYLVGDLIINGAITIIGLGKNRPSIKSKASVQNLFTLRSRDITIENLHIDMSLTTSTSSTAFYFDTANYTPFYSVQIRNIEVWSAYCAIKDANSTGGIINTYFEQITCVFCKGTQINLNDTQGFIFFTKVAVDLTTNTSPVTFPGWLFNNTAGLILNDCDVLGHGTGVSTLANGFEFNNCVAVWFNRVMCDFIGNLGIKITNSQYLYLNDIVTSLCIGGGISITDCTSVKGGSINSGGTKGQSYSVASKNGMSLTRVNGFNAANLHLYNNTGDGLSFFDCSKINFGVLQSTDNQGYGLQETQTGAGTSVANMLGSCITAGNVTGNAKLVGAYTYITSIMLNSGTAQFQKVGPVTL